MQLLDFMELENLLKECGNSSLSDQMWCEKEGVFLHKEGKISDCKCDYNKTSFQSIPLSLVIFMQIHLLHSLPLQCPLRYLVRGI